MKTKNRGPASPPLRSPRYVESIVAGITISAHPDFRSAVTMNPDEFEYEVPTTSSGRLQPTLTLPFPADRNEMAILQYHLHLRPKRCWRLTVEFLQHAHELKLDFSPRDGINPPAAMQ